MAGDGDEGRTRYFATSGLIIPGVSLCDFFGEGPAAFSIPVLSGHCKELDPLPCLLRGADDCVASAPELAT